MSMNLGQGYMDPFDPSTGAFGMGLGNPGNSGSSGGGSSSNASQLGDMFSMFGPIGNILGGFANAQGDAIQAAMIQRNADLGLENANLAMSNYALKAQQVGGQQAVEYANSGVTLAGTPALVMQQTARLAQQQLHMMSQGAANTYQVQEQQAMNARTAGRAAILGGFMKAGTSLATSFAGGF